MKKTFLVIFLVILSLSLLWAGGAKEKGAAGAVKGPSIKDRDPDTLIFVLRAQPQPLDPNLFTTLYEAQIMREINETLIGIRPDGSFYPVLATEIPTKENGGFSADGATVTLKLRRNVSFHNGNPFTAEDVVFSFNRILHHPKSASKSMFAAIKKVEAVDPHTVKITTGYVDPKYGINQKMESWADREQYMVAAPYGPIINILAHYCSGIENKATVEKAGADYGTKVVVGTGPYKFVSWPNPQEVNITRNDSWWNGADKVAFKNIQYRAISENQQVANALRTGEIDVSHNISRLELDSLGKAGVSLARGQGAGRTMYYIGFSMYSPMVGQLKDGKPDKSGSYTPQDSTYLRSAIFYSIDPVPFTKQVDIFNGTAVPADQIMHPGLIGYVTDRPAGTTLGEWKKESSYFNAAKAKEFFNKLSPEFKAKLTPESLNFIVSNIPERVKMANIIKDQVKTTLGVDLLKVIPMVHAQLIGMGKTGEGYDISFFGWFTPTLDSDYTCIIYSSDSVGTGMNAAVYSNAKVQDNIVKARHSVDPAVRKAAYTAATVQLLEDKPYVPLVYQDVIIGYNPRVGALEENLFGTEIIDVHNLKKLQ